MWQKNLILDWKIKLWLYYNTWNKISELKNWREKWEPYRFVAKVATFIKYSTIFPSTVGTRQGHVTSHVQWSVSRRHVLPPGWNRENSPLSYLFDKKLCSKWWCLHQLGTCVTMWSRRNLTQFTLNMSMRQTVVGLSTKTSQQKFITAKPGPYKNQSRRFNMWLTGIAEQEH